MRVALMINRENFEMCSDWKDTSWELLHFGNGEPDAQIVIESKADVLVVDAIMRIGPDIIEHMPGLKMIHSQGVAYNGIDTKSAYDHGVYVCNCAGINAKPVAEQALLLMLALLKKFRWGEDMVYEGRQMEAKMACFSDGMPEVGGLTIGIVGLGAIGKTLAALLKPFGCKILFYDKIASDIEYTPLDELYAKSDIVSLHVPVTPETTNMINSESLKQFKHGAILINTARGELMDHKAVVDALVSGVLGGLGADTLAPEPFLLDNPILSDLPEHLRWKVALSPHIAGITTGTFIRAYDRIGKNIEAINADQKPQNIVNNL